MKVLAALPWDAPRAPSGPARSTVEALLRVRCGLDLSGVRAYREPGLARAWVVRERDALVVRRGLPGDGAEPQALTQRERLGLLHPVQRYVTRGRLDRARRQAVLLRDELTDPWGFLRIEADDGTVVALAPPVVERTGDGDALVVCDGSHRIVARSWQDRRAVAVAVHLHAPVEPYYALPMPEDDWELVSRTQLEQPPVREEKYLVRPVPARVSQKLRGDPADHHRRWFRDLKAAFAP